MHLIRIGHVYSAFRFSSLHHAEMYKITQSLFNSQKTALSCLPTESCFYDNIFTGAVDQNKFQTSFWHILYNYDLDNVFFKLRAILGQVHAQHAHCSPFKE